MLIASGRAAIPKAPFGGASDSAVQKLDSRISSRSTLVVQ